MRVRSGMVVVIGVLMVAALVAGCGETTTASSPSPSPSATDGGIAGRLAALKAYTEEVKPIATQVAATASSLPEALKGMSTKPDATWTAAAEELDAAAAEMGDAAESLSALTPPESLQPVQDAAVKGVESVQATITKTAARLEKRVATSETRRSKLEAQMEALQSQLSSLSEQLLGAIEALTGG
jgi:hypothetical protein